MKRTCLPALLSLCALPLAAQAPAGLTARELYYVPTGATISQAAPPAPKKAAVPKPAQPPPQVAVNRPPAKTARPEPPAQPPQEIRTSNEVRIVAASYSGPRPLGLRYALLKRSAQGEWDEVSADSVFHSGDKIRVRVESNENAYLYIVARGSSGNWDVLFPSRDINGGDNKVESGAEQVIPNRRGQWTFDDRKGEERLFLVLSRKPVGDLDTLIYDLSSGVKATPKKTAAPKQSQPERVMLAQALPPVNDALIGRLRNSVMARDLVFEKVDDKPSVAAPEKQEHAMYVVEKSGRVDARLIADIKLQHD